MSSPFDEFRRKREAAQALEDNKRANELMQQSQREQREAELKKRINTQMTHYDSMVNGVLWDLKKAVFPESEIHRKPQSWHLGEWWIHDRVSEIEEDYAVVKLNLNADIQPTGFNCTIYIRGFPDNSVIDSNGIEIITLDRDSLVLCFTQLLHWREKRMTELEKKQQKQGWFRRLFG